MTRSQIQKTRTFAKARTWCLRIALASILESAYAGPPFVTDDPEPPLPGGWEINIPFTIERTSGMTGMDAPLLDLNYGLPDIQLKVEVPIRVVHEDSDGTMAGAGDLLMGIKWRFFNSKKSQLQFGIYPQLLVPSGDHDRGLGEGQPAFVFPIVAQKSWDKWTLYGNVGFWWQTAADQRNYVYAGAVLEREINDRLELGFELFGNSPKEHDSRSDIAFNIGGTLKLSRHLNLLFSGGRDIIGDTHLMAYLGIQVLTK